MGLSDFFSLNEQKSTPSNTKSEDINEKPSSIFSIYSGISDVAKGFGSTLSSIKQSIVIPESLKNAASSLFQITSNTVSSIALTEKINSIFSKISKFVKSTLYNKNLLQINHTPEPTNSVKLSDYWNSENEFDSFRHVYETLLNNVDIKELISFIDRNSHKNHMRNSAPNESILKMMHFDEIIRRQFPLISKLDLEIKNKMKLSIISALQFFYSNFLNVILGALAAIPLAPIVNQAVCWMSGVCGIPSFILKVLLTYFASNFFYNFSPLLAEKTTDVLIYFVGEFPNIAVSSILSSMAYSVLNPLGVFSSLTNNMSAVVSNYFVGQMLQILYRKTRMLVSVESVEEESDSQHTFFDIFHQTKSVDTLKMEFGICLFFCCLSCLQMRGKSYHKGYYLIIIILLILLLWIAFDFNFQLQSPVDDHFDNTLGSKANIGILARLINLIWFYITHCLLLIFWYLSVVSTFFYLFHVLRLWSAECKQYFYLIWQKKDLKNKLRVQTQLFKISNDEFGLKVKKLVNKKGFPDYYFAKCSDINYKKFLRSSKWLTNDQFEWLYNDIDEKKNGQ